jgi:hypothetical protein
LAAGVTDAVVEVGGAAGGVRTTGFAIGIVGFFAATDPALRAIGRGFGNGTPRARFDGARKTTWAAAEPSSSALQMFARGRLWFTSSSLPKRKLIGTNRTCRPEVNNYYCIPNVDKNQIGVRCRSLPRSWGETKTVDTGITPAGLSSGP